MCCCPRVGVLVLGILLFVVQLEAWEIGGTEWLNQLELVGRILVSREPQLGLEVLI